MIPRFDSRTNHNTNDPASRLLDNLLIESAGRRLPHLGIENGIGLGKADQPV